MRTNKINKKRKRTKCIETPQNKKISRDKESPPNKDMGLVRKPSIKD